MLYQNIQRAQEKQHGMYIQIEVKEVNRRRHCKSVC